MQTVDSTIRPSLVAAQRLPLEPTLGNSLPAAQWPTLHTALGTSLCPAVGPPNDAAHVETH